MTRLTRAQGELLRACRLSKWGVSRSPSLRRTAACLERLGLITVRSVDPVTWADAHPPRTIVIRITQAGRRACGAADGASQGGVKS